MFRHRNVFIVFFLTGVIFLLQYLFSPPVFACSGICGQVILEPGGTNYAGATVKLSDGESQSTTSNGYSFSPACPAGTVTATLTVPAGYYATTATSGSESVGGCVRTPHYVLTCTTRQYCVEECVSLCNDPVLGKHVLKIVCIPQQVCLVDPSKTTYTTSPPTYPSGTLDFGIEMITYSISGTVTDSTGAGVPNVTVSAGGHNATTDANGNYTFSNLVPGSYTVSMTVPAGYIANGATSQTVTLTGNKTGVNFKLNKMFLISGTVYNDTNENGKLDNGEAGYQGITVKLTNGSGSQTVTSDANGNYSFQVNSTAGNSTVTISGIPAGWFNSTAVSQTVASNVNTTGLNFGIAQENTISGNLFVDPNKNGIKDGNEVNYSGSPVITSPNGGTVATNANGSYAISKLVPGTYTVTYGPTLPAGYYMTSPLTGPPISFRVTVGTGCSVNGAPGATCNGLNITNLNFGISNTYPWFQSTCGDMRNDNGITDSLPAGQYGLITAASCTNPGVGFTGNSNANFGSGQASITNQIVGGAAYPELSASNTPLQTAYTSLLSKATSAGVTPIDLSTKCTLSNCSLPAGLGHGIYLANGNVTLNAYTFSTNQNYVLLVNGNLTINGAISVPVGSTALLSTNGNITVKPTVGTSATVTTSSLDGWYIAGGSFILPTQGNCTDLRLNIAGSVVVNALGTGGTFQNNRDLCGGDTADPTVSFLQRLDMILNAPLFIETQQTRSQEVSP